MLKPVNTIANNFQTYKKGNFKKCTKCKLKTKR